MFTFPARRLQFELAIVERCENLAGLDDVACPNRRGRNVTVKRRYSSALDCAFDDRFRCYTKVSLRERKISENTDYPNRRDLERGAPWTKQRFEG